MAGRKVLEALLIYFKIDVHQSLRELSLKSSKKEEAIEQFAIEPPTINVEALQKELMENKELIKMTEGKEDGDDGGSSGSDSDPSEDNLEEEEIAKIVPIKSKKKQKPEAKRKSASDVKYAKKKM